MLCVRARVCVGGGGGGEELCHGVAGFLIHTIPDHIPRAWEAVLSRSPARLFPLHSIGNAAFLHQSPGRCHPLWRFSIGISTVSQEGEEEIEGCRDADLGSKG